VSTPKRLRLLLAEDHFLPRFAVLQLIALESDLEVVGEADTGARAVELYRQLRPDVVLMDVRMPEQDGIAATAAIVKEDPAARVLMLSHYDDEEDVGRALEAGARGYLKKDVGATELLAAIRAVAAGGVHVDARAAEAARLRASDRRLSAREREILTLVGKGASNREIGVALGITEGTVRIHVSHIISKLGVTRRTEAVTAALKRGLLTLD
jgi:DNA-binding NarL/FixJ family response regulator